MTAWLWLPATLTIGSLAFVAIVAALASGIPEAQRDDDLFFTAEERAEHDAAWEQHVTSAPGISDCPIHDELAVEAFRRELDEKLRDGLAGWGDGEIA